MQKNNVENISMRDDMRSNFIKSCDIGKLEITQIASDASLRKYYRLRIPTSNKTFILMDALPEYEKIMEFVKIANFLLEHKFYVARIYQSDIENGFLLLEDLGNQLLSKVVSVNPEIEVRLYQSAIDILLKLNQIKNLPNLVKYDLPSMGKESDLFAKWYIEKIPELGNANIISNEYKNIVREILSNHDDNLRKDSFVHRDYHADNLLVNNDSKNPKISMIDFQDAVAGDSAYDIASLLEDARRDISSEIKSICLRKFIDETGENEEEFMLRYKIVSAIRNCKIIGIFNRLKLRDNKPSYMNFLPRVWKNLQGDLSHPKLIKLSKFLERENLLR